MPQGIYKRIMKRGGWKLSKETKRKMSESSRHIATFGMRGKKHSEETKQKMSISMTGKSHSSKGVPLTEEHKKHLREANNSTRFKKGNIPPFKGKKIPSEIIEKMRLSKIGKTGENSNNWKGGLTLHPQYRSFLQRRRVVKKYMNGGSHTQGQWELLKAQYGLTCPCCKKSEPEIKLTEDHIIPLEKGGTDNIENIQPLCRSCNSKKHTKIIHYENIWQI